MGGDAVESGLIFSVASCAAMVLSMMYSTQKRTQNNVVALSYSILQTASAVIILP